MLNKLQSCYSTASVCVVAVGATKAVVVTVVVAACVAAAVVAALLDQVDQEWKELEQQLGGYFGLDAAEF